MADRGAELFSATMENFEVERGADEELMLVCSLCTEDICAVEAGDTLRVLIHTALGHTCAI